LVVDRKHDQTMKYRVILLSALLLTACSRQVEKTELPGLYEFVVEDLKQQINIATDGKYVNTLYRGGAVVWSDQSVWRYEVRDGEGAVVFSRFRFGIPGHSSVAGLWYVVPEKTFSGAKDLCFDPDLGLCFRAK
jgi:hypothetical protein